MLKIQVYQWGNYAVPASTIHTEDNAAVLFRWMSKGFYCRSLGSKLAIPTHQGALAPYSSLSSVELQYLRRVHHKTTRRIIQTLNTVTGVHC